MSQQLITIENGDYREITKYFEINNIKNVFLVCSKSYKKLLFSKYMDSIAEKRNISITYFMDFEPNPDIVSVDKGADLFSKNHYDAIIAVGGGSGIDVAKCIKNRSGNNQKLIAVPTTAGTGSESTKFAVVYSNGEKQSIENENMLPDVVILDGSCLESLPDYQRKVTILDALCHCIESYWSINSTEESKKYSVEALKLIMEYKDDYLKNIPDAYQKMLIAANMAGKAINISKTTAGHALCYKLTKLYGVPHGYAAAICLSEIWNYMVDNRSLCIDERGADYFELILRNLSVLIGGKNVEDGPILFRALLDKLDLNKVIIKENDIEILVESVNAQRLGNHPVKLDGNAIETIYRRMIS